MFKAKLRRRLWFCMAGVFCAVSCQQQAFGGLITISAQQQQSGFIGYIPAPLYSSDVYAPPITLGAFDFTGTDYASLRSIESISLELTIISGDTGLGEDDFDQLSLWIDNIETGVKLNGFPFGQWASNTVTGTPMNGAEVLWGLRATGQLQPQLYDSCCASGDLREYIAIGIPSFDYRWFLDGLLQRVLDPNHPITDPENMMLVAEWIKGTTGVELSGDQIAQLLFNLPANDRILAETFNLSGGEVYATLTITGSDAPEAGSMLLVLAGLAAVALKRFSRGRRV